MSHKINSESISIYKPHKSTGITTTQRNKTPLVGLCSPGTIAHGGRAPTTNEHANTDHLPRRGHPHVQVKL